MRTLAWLSILPACAADKAPADTAEPADTAVDSGDDIDSGDTAEDTDPLAPPCGDGTWGEITDPETAVHVSVDGDDTTGDGSADSPFATLDAALTATRALGTGQSIAVWPGSWEVALVLASDLGGGLSDSGLTLAGCGPDESVLVGSSTTEPVLQVAGATGVTVSGLTLSGGYRGVIGWQGASLTMREVHVVGSTRDGIAFDGPEGVVTLEDVEVRDIVPEDTDIADGVGYGVSVRMGTLVMRGGGVWNASRAGIVAESAALELTDVTVADTAPVDGRLGRGIHLQLLSSATLTGLSLLGNSDAGLFSSRSGNLVVVDTVIEGTLAATLPDAADTTGDGLVACQLSEDGTVFDPSTFHAEITGTIVTGSARAGIVVDGIEASLDANTAGADNGYSSGGTSIYTQGSASTSGGDRAVPLGDGGDPSLGLNAESISPDALGE